MTNGPLSIHTPRGLEELAIFTILQGTGPLIDGYRHRELAAHFFALEILRARFENGDVTISPRISWMGRSKLTLVMM